MVVIKGGAMSAGDMLRDGSMDARCVIKVDWDQVRVSRRRGEEDLQAQTRTLVLTVRADMRQ